MSVERIKNHLEGLSGLYRNQDYELAPGALYGDGDAEDVERYNAMQTDQKISFLQNTILGEARRLNTDERVALKNQVFNHRAFTHIDHQPHLKAFIEKVSVLDKKLFIERNLLMLNHENKTITRETSLYSL